MPELPEVESVRRTLEPGLLGRRIAAVRVSRPEVIEGKATPRSLLVGSTVTELRRRGKQLAILADTGRCLVVHLGMTGQLMIAPTARAPALTHVHVVWSIGTDRVASRQRQVLLFRDPRRFGGIWTLDSVADLEGRWSSLGPDALTITSHQLATGLNDSRRAIKAALLDQQVLAGVGNIYADEALFAAGINPTRRARSLSTSELEALATALRDTLAASITAGGSTLRDFVNARGEPGSYRTRHAVYGRAGEACLRCRKRLRSAQVGQRTTVWCGHCQPSRRQARAG